MLVDVAFGFVVGAVFSFVRSYVLRLFLGALAIVAIYTVMLNLAGHAGFQWNTPVVLRGIFGALVAAHIRFIFAR